MYEISSSSTSNASSSADDGEIIPNPPSLASSVIPSRQRIPTKVFTSAQRLAGVRPIGLSRPAPFRALQVISQPNVILPPAVHLPDSYSSSGDPKTSQSTAASSSAQAVSSNGDSGDDDSELPSLVGRAPRKMVVRPPWISEPVVNDVAVVNDSAYLADLEGMCV